MILVLCKVGSTGRTSMILVLYPVGISWEDIYDPSHLYSRDQLGRHVDPGPMDSRDKLGGHL
jgi:hypothetical protein